MIGRAKPASYLVAWGEHLIFCGSFGALMATGSIARSRAARWNIWRRAFLPTETSRFGLESVHAGAAGNAAACSQKRPGVSPAFRRGRVNVAGAHGGVAVTPVVLPAYVRCEEHYHVGRRSVRAAHAAHGCQSSRFKSRPDRRVIFETLNTTRMVGGNL